MVDHVHLNWREQFGRAARRDLEKARFLHEQFKRDMEEARQQQVEADHDATDLVLEMVLASPASIAAFRVRLDSYDEATVAALMDNEKALEEVQRRIDGMLLQAHILLDGRRVFRTRDGTVVFDEAGNEVGRDQIDPGEIDPKRPVWEDYRAARLTEQGLKVEREELLRFQQKIDGARERADDPKLTQNELDELKRDLETSAPESVRRRMPGGTEPSVGGAEMSGQRQAAVGALPSRSLGSFVPQ